MRQALSRTPTSRIPCMPQICYDTPIRLYDEEDGGDWRDRMAVCLRAPEKIYDYVIRLVEEIDCDGLRLFIPSDPMRVIRENDELVVTNDDDDRIGKIDVEGGGGFLADRPKPAVDTIGEVRERCRAQVDAQTDEKRAMLSEARSRVPNRFVASSPFGMTMNTYTALRGREQAMIDLYERPDFVADAMQVQLEAAIEVAEGLLSTGVDAFYIGDPAASASLISPAHFERFCLPVYQAFCRHFADSDVLIYIHVCGNSGPILEMLADTGADAVEPLDPLGGVSVADAKRRIGTRVALMGGVNTLTLSGGTPEEVRAESEAKCREGGPHGYVLAAGDMVPPTTSLENLRALVETAKNSSRLFA